MEERRKPHKRIKMQISLMLPVRDEHDPQWMLPFGSSLGLHTSWWWQLVCTGHLQGLGTTPSTLQVSPILILATALGPEDTGVARGRACLRSTPNLNPGLLWFPGGSDSKDSACNTESRGLLPGLGRSLGEGNGYSLLYSCLENSRQLTDN